MSCSLDWKDRLSFGAIIYDPFKHQNLQEIITYADKNRMPCFYKYICR
jgi:hypothetical protein